MNKKKFTVAVISLVFILVSSISPVWAQKMYWTKSGTDKIQRADLDGSNVEDLVTTGLSSPSGIALDLQPPVDSTITYQGQLHKEGVPINEICDLQFTLWTETTGGLRVGPVHTLADVAPDKGRITQQYIGGGGVPSLGSYQNE